MIKKLLLNKTKFFTVLVFLFAFYGNVNAQTYTITGDVNSSTLTCATFSGKTIVYIGDGVIDSKLIMNNNLDLTTCGLGPIQLIIRNKGILEYPDKTNNNLNLPAGSSVVIESGGNIATVGSCSNSDLIQIGGNSVGSCNGAGALPTFDEVVENGWINEAGILSGNQYICSIGGNTTFTSSISGGTFTSGSTSVATVNATSGVITAVAVGQSVITYTKGTKSTTRIVYVGSSFGGTVSGGTTLCSSTNSTVLTLSGYKGTIIRWESSLNNFLTGTAIANTTSSYTVTNLVNTTSYRAVINGTGCTANSTSATIIVGTNLSAGVSIAASSSGAICAGTSVTFTATPTNGGTTPTYQWKLNGTNVGINTNTYTNSALSNNDLVTCVMISNATCVTGSPATSNTITMVVNSANTWTGTTSSSWFAPTNWSCGSVPIASSDVTIPNVTRKPIIDDSSKIALTNTLTVSSGASLTVNSGNTIKVMDKVTNNGGTITFEDSASLLQSNNVANSGNIIYKRATTTIREFDFTYWSSPVAGQNLLAVSPTSKSDKFFSFDGTDWVQENPSTTTMKIGKGYIIRGVPLPMTHPPAFPVASFYGVPNNGDISIAVTGGQTSNLIGNPYPSAIYADQFLFDNQSSIDGTIYFWTHNTPIAIGTPDPGTGVWAYSGNDYASYSLTGGVGTGSGKGSTIPGTPPTENVSNRPTGKIAAGQSFFTTSTASGGTVKLTNKMRVDGSGNPLNNTNFYKTTNSKTKTTATIEKHRVWLNLTNKEGAFKQTLVGYLTGATNTWDKLYDGESFDGNDFLDFYSINGDKNLTIQGRALPFDQNDEVPLGYRIAVEGAFTINIDEVDGLLTNQSVFLEDKLTNTVVDLKAGNYTFSTAAGTFNDRFVLKYSDKTLGTNNPGTMGNNEVLVSAKNNQIKISSSVEMIDKVAIYDLLGRQIYQKNNVDSNEFSISNLVSSHQTLIVKTTLKNGKTVADKIIY